MTDKVAKNRRYRKNAGQRFGPLVRDECINRWPEVFNSGSPLPLAIGIHKQLLEAGLNRRGVWWFLHRWTSSTKYLQALRANRQRINLDGSSYGLVSADSEKAARQQLKERFKRGSQYARANVQNRWV